MYSVVDIPSIVCAAQYTKQSHEEALLSVKRTQYHPSKTAVSLRLREQAADPQEGPRVSAPVSRRFSDARVAIMGECLRRKKRETVPQQWEKVLENIVCVCVCVCVCV